MSNKKLDAMFLSMQLHMQYLRLMEDSERTRSACIQYIRTWLHEFYPYRVDIARELKAIAAGLGVRGPGADLFFHESRGRE
jgi:hypothetical protein